MAGLRLASAAAAAAVVLAAIGGPSSVSWNTPTAEPGRNEGGQPTFQGGMPLGNGDLAVLAWPNVTAGSLDLYVAKADAFASDTLLFKLAHVSLSVNPNPFTGAAYFNQTLDLQSGTVRSGGFGADAGAPSRWTVRRRPPPPSRAPPRTPR